MRIKVRNKNFEKIIIILRIYPEECFLRSLISKGFPIKIFQLYSHTYTHPYTYTHVHSNFPAIKIVFSFQS